MKNKSIHVLLIMLMVFLTSCNAPIVVVTLKEIIGLSIIGLIIVITVVYMVVLWVKDLLRKWRNK